MSVTGSNNETPRPVARLIVCERSGRWAGALRRELAGAGVRVWETRTFDDCCGELAASPASFIVAELRANSIERLLRFLSDTSLRFPAARVAVSADRSLNDYDSLVREAGAVHFLSSPRRAGLLARLACRHLAHAPAPAQGMAERIWASLPWGG